MKKQYLIIGVLLSTLLFFCTSCEKCDHLVLDGNDAYITSCEVVSESSVIEGAIDGNNITINLPTEVDINSIKVNFTLSEKAFLDVHPDEISDWSLPQKFVVTSGNQLVSNTYTLTVEREDIGEIIRLGSQADVDAFGKYNFESIGGLVLFNKNDEDPILDMTPLASLKEVRGNINIKYLQAKTVIFENLEIAGRIFIHSPLLHKIQMPKLRTIADEFSVGNGTPSGQVPEEHAELVEIYTPHLESIGGRLSFFFCSQLSTLEYFSNLSFVGGDIEITGGNFKSLKGFENIKHTRGNFKVTGPIYSLDGFAIESVAASLYLHLDNVQSLEPLKSLKKVGVSLQLKRNSYLTDFSGLEHIDAPVILIELFMQATSLKGLPIKPEMNYLSIRSCPELSNIDALSILKSCKESLYIKGCAKITNLNALQNLNYIGDNIGLEYLDNLTDASGLNNINHIGAGCQLAKMRKLLQLPNFSQLTEVGELYIENLLALESLDGLEHITQIKAGGLTVLSCPRLTDLSGIANINTVLFKDQSDKIQFELNTLLKSYVPVGPLLQKYVTKYGKMRIMKNGYNPTARDIKNGRFTGEGGAGISGGK